MGEETNFRELLQDIETALFDAQDIDPAAFLQALQHAKPAFLNLLRYKEPNAESRAAVQSGKPVTAAGPIVLDLEPDVREVLLLADEMHLDEVLAVLCVQTALQEMGEVSAAAGAGIYFEERRGLLTSLWLLLQAQVMSADSLPPQLYQAVCSFNIDLLVHSAGSCTVLVHRLAELIRDNRLEAQPGSRLPLVVDGHGQEVDRNALVQREQTILCECLVYACCIRQRLTTADIADLVDLLHRLGLKARAAGGGDLAAQQQAYCVLMAVLLSLVSLENAEGGDAEADERMLHDLAAAQGLDQKISSGGSAEDQHWAVVKLAWGVLQSQYGPESSAEHANHLVQAATDSGALAFLKYGVLDSVPMQDDADHQRQLYASIVNQLLMAFLMSPAGKDSITTLSDASVRQGEEELAQSAQLAAQGSVGMLMAVDAVQQAAPTPKRDSLATLLALLACVYGIHPDLFLDDALRYEVFGEFMEMVAASEAITASPSTFLAYLEVLTALAAGEKGARSMYAQLRGDDRFAMVNWKRMFQLLVAIVQRYVPEEGKEAGGGGGGGTAPAGSVQQHTQSDFVLAICDSKALCAYLGLFRRVISEGRVEEMLSWMRQLEEDAGVTPVWEILFQAMCCPVPQDLKAALDDAIGSLARRPDVAATLWERLVAAVVVAPVSGEVAAVPRYDLTYQLNEIEARAEDYVETLAFVRLLTALWRGGGSAALPDDGRSVAHFTKFVRDELLGTVFQRAYKDERQRWLLVAACLEHCELCLASLHSLVGLATNAASSAAVKPPGLEVLLDLLAERNTLRAAMATCLVEVDRLAYERHASPFGAAKEAAVLAALRLLRVALGRDVELVVAMHSASYETLDAVLRHDRRRIPMLLDFVRYPHNPAVQAEAVRIATHLSERIPNLVPLLLNSPSTGSLPAVQRLQDGFAACLQSSLFNLAAIVVLEDDGAAPGCAEGKLSGEDSGDPRATLVLQLLLSSLEQPAPNLAHLLCGYEFDSGMGQAFLPDPRVQYNVLRVLLSAVHSPTLSARKPALFEQSMEVLYELAASPVTGVATLDLLRGYYALLGPLLGSVACATLPEAGEQRTSSLHTRAWLLQLHALELHRADAALTHHAQSVEGLLMALFSAEPPEVTGATQGPGQGLGQGRSRMLDLLDMVTSATPQEPQLGSEVQPEVRRMLQALELDTLLVAGTAVQQGGVRTVSHRGVGLFDVVALKDELLKRYNEWVARHGGASDALKEACREALQYAQQYNAYVELLAGQAALLAAWQAVLLVAFTRRFDRLAVVAGGLSLVELVMQMAEECLRVLATLVSGSAIGLAPALCEAVQALLARLQEQVVAASTADPLAGMPLPARCHGLLQLLLEVTWQGRKLDAVRLPMYSALASYLTMCRGPVLLRTPPPVVEALLASMPAGGSAASQLDALQSKLEEGNAVLLHEASPLLELLGADALSAEPAQATAALTVLCAVLAADPSSGAAGELYRVALPTRIMGDLQEAPHRALTQPPTRGQALMLVVEAQLTLLLRLALAGPAAARPASAQKLFGLHVLVKLSRCRAVDLQPEEPGFGQYSGTASLRQRLHHLLTPLLRLVLAVVMALPSSSAVREQALTFTDDHTRTLTRILHDAASPGIRGWEPGDAELEEATLVMQLLAELVQTRHLLAAGPQLQEAAYRLSARFLCLSSKSPSPVVARVTSTRDAGRLSPHVDRTYLRVLSLRGALSHYLLQLASDPRDPVLFRVTTPALGGNGVGMDVAGLMPTLFLFKDAMLQAVVQDMPKALEEEALLLEALRTGEAAGGMDLPVAPAAVVNAGGPGGSATGVTRARLAQAASTASAQLGKLLYLTEHLLAILYNHLRLTLPAPELGSASPEKGMLAYGANGSVEEDGTHTRQALGSERDLDQLRRLMEPIVMTLESATARVGTSLAHRDVASLQLLVRRTKEYLGLL